MSPASLLVTLFLFRKISKLSGVEGEVKKKKLQKRQSTALH